MGLFPEDAFQIQKGSLLAEHGAKIFETWIGLAFQDPPKDFLGRLLWSFGVLGQVIISWATFPAALAAFLLEESVQSYGMGAYIISSSGYYDLLDNYLPGYKTFIEMTTAGAKTLATINPVTGGAVVIYIEAAKQSYNAFRQIADRKLLEQAEKDEELRQKLLDDATYGTVALSSSPSQAEVWINGVNTEKLTPETFKRLPAGTHTFEVRKFSVKREEWDIFVFSVDVTAGYKSEILARIPPGVTSPDEDEPDVGRIRVLSNAGRRQEIRV